jgi:aquaporin Z
MFQSLRHHWPEYLMEAAGLGIFMISAGVFTTLLLYPGSPISHAISSPFARRAYIGAAMGLTAVALIYSPWGQQSGAHYNPAVTLTFLRLGKVRPWDAVFYIGSQFIGGAAGVLLLAAILRGSFRLPPVFYVATLPGPTGPAVAFLAEGLISFTMMGTILIVSNTRVLARYTGFFAGLLVFTFITLEAPFSGMSMNPARSLSSALPARAWANLWIYFTAPVLGMLLAADATRCVRGTAVVFCAKLHHETARRCIFCASRNALLLAGIWILCRVRYLDSVCAN